MIQKLVLIFIFHTLSIHAQSVLPYKYQSLKGCEKRDILWKNIEATQYKQRPSFKEFGFIQVAKMGFQSMTTKVSNLSDITPRGWTKYIHAHGSVAKVKFISSEDHPYSGLFKGVDCALLRLSLTFKPQEGSRNVAPGLAFKMFRDGLHSANISALYSLNGQEQNYNFFTNPLSNIVPAESGIGPKLIHRIFGRVTKTPEELGTTDISLYDQLGKRAIRTLAPKQIFFVPLKVEELDFSTSKHDVRDDFEALSPGTEIYEVRALTKNYDYKKYSIDMLAGYLKESIVLGKVVTESRFISSSYGDSRLFFRHEANPKK